MSSITFNFNIPPDIFSFWCSKIKILDNILPSSKIVLQHYFKKIKNITESVFSLMCANPTIPTEGFYISIETANIIMMLYFFENFSACINDHFRKTDKYLSLSVTKYKKIISIYTKNNIIYDGKNSYKYTFFMGLLPLSLFKVLETKPELFNKYVELIRILPNAFEVLNTCLNNMLILFSSEFNDLLIQKFNIYKDVKILCVFFNPIYFNSLIKYSNDSNYDYIIYKLFKYYKKTNITYYYLMYKVIIETLAVNKKEFTYDDVLRVHRFFLLHSFAFEFKEKIILEHIRNIIFYFINVEINKEIKGEKSNYSHIIQFLLLINNVLRFPTYSIIIDFSKSEIVEYVNFINMNIKASLYSYQTLYNKRIFDILNCECFIMDE